ncbi:putative nuclease HARBI1 isoform X2 [Sitophilus oryzae]|uniref:Nuclease HARBI1 isoform X2 n=1 Tax=Sitophilus oryzae TaxID=7048 RepID=A0A6J2XFG2_SITOR|nr:putative nuclease HARBI1 isoform X2 [Sitophilus oryzae]XP_030748528.1 putative nuclease HARBI1 isoform X2 [Sitophilus oryzae]XP_030749876.1 putative nuclease HARBI1 isoform X2 [Sitophilus oryzae]XP_030762246.1 putative nuclease HARBI1 isoform X2 [Sitophilus oryzae]XP_030763489.1 putative nuclease HARBI1 isoform X2 [Sitophilus oryzae]XP_030765046.1 putative nuclease HARBI1 isoform X2 [Sitophilus oryzae]
MDNFEQIAINLIENIENAEGQRRQRFFPDNPFALSDYNFVKLYRLRKENVQDLENLLGPFLPAQHKVDALTNRNKILLTLRFLAGGSYQLDIGRNQMMKVSQSSVSRSLHSVIDAFNHHNILNTYIHFPNSMEELRDVRQRFFNLYRLPGIIGCIDCTHIAIVAPVINEHIYMNRKGFHSLNVQMICDEKLRITNVNARFCGSTHDSFIWQNSNIERFLSELPQNEMGNFYLFGDSGYPIRPWLITPFLPEPEPDTPEARFNRRFRAIRVTVERCFGLLKNRFRCLLKHRVLHYTPETAAKIVNTCAVLHNICLENNIPLYNDEEMMGFNEVEGGNLNENINHIPDNNVLGRGREVRQLLVNNYFV